MRDLQDRLPQLLQDLSSDAPGDVARAEAIVRRARRRRGRTVVVATAAAVAVLVATLFGVRELTPVGPTTIGTSDGSSASPVAPPATTAIGAVWPETTSAGLASAQQQVDDGHQPWRTDPTMTAEAFAVNVFGWSPQDVHSAKPESAGEAVVVDVANGTDQRPTAVTLDQLGTTGETGVWSVTSADTQLLTTTLGKADGGPTILVRVPDAAVSTVKFAVYEGPTLDAPTSGGAVADGGTIPLPSTSPEGAVVVVVSAIDADTTLGADVISVPTEVEASSSTGPASGPASTPSPQALPIAVERTQKLLIGDVEALDIPALQALMDPNTFSYNADDGSNPIVLWKEQPSVLDPIPKILALPAAAPRSVDGYPTTYVWPYLVDVDFSRLSPGQVDDLHALGFDDAAIQRMEQAGRYTGPRLSIDEKGVWTSYSTGGNV